MVVIRLSRMGGKKNPFYHLVVADQRQSRDGRYIELIGYYHPNARGQDIRLQIKKERANYWLSKGAIPSERVAHLINHFEKSPDAAQKAGPTISEIKRAQVKTSAKAQKAAKKTEADSTDADDTDAKAETAETKSEVKSDGEE